LRGRRRAVSPTGCRGSGDRGPGGCPGVTRGKWRLGPSGRPAGVLTAWGAVGIEGLRLTGVRHLSSKGSCLETEVSPNGGGSTLRPRGSLHRRIGETARLAPTKDVVAVRDFRAGVDLAPPAA